MKIKKMVVTVLVLTIFLYLLLAFSSITTSNSFAADKNPGTLDPNISSIDDNLYPGYKSLINNLQSKHSNYRFLVYYTGFTWEEVLAAEYQGHGHSPLNLFQIGTNYNGMWICPICGNKAYDNGSWCCSSLEALSYMMDPRNSINDSDVFQFKDLEGGDVTYNDIARVVSGYGSYINNQEVIQAIVDASNQFRINGYFLVAKIINEHGKNGSTLSNGQGYNGNYVGIYNYFNIGSTGNGTATIINNGLSYAQRQGWNSRRNSIIGGASIIRKKYMEDYSQNTFYYQKFNVSGLSSMASHQYQQNIMAAQSQGSSLKAYYASSSNNVNHTFIIPLYKNMPKVASGRPSLTTQNKITYEDGIVQNISTSLKVRASSNGSAIGALNNNESIKILRRASSKVGNYYWDLIVSNKDGTYGYAARASTSGEQYIVSKGTSGTSSGSVAPTDPFVNNNNDNNNNNNNDNPPTPTTPQVNLETDIKVSGNYINILPNITCENIKTKYKDAIVKKSDGTAVTTGSLGTGYSVTVGEKTYKIVKKGDTNGDGTVTVVDAVVLLNAVKGTKTLENEFKEAASVKGETTFNVTDAVFLLNYIKGATKIVLK